LDNRKPQQKEPKMNGKETVKNEGKSEGAKMPAAETQGTNGTVGVNRKPMLDLVHALNRAAEKLEATGVAAPLVTWTGENKPPAPAPKRISKLSLEWNGLHGGVHRATLSGHPETTMFLLTPLSDGSFVMSGAFIPDAADGLRWKSEEDAKNAAMGYLLKWMRMIEKPWSDELERVNAFREELRGKYQRLSDEHAAMTASAPTNKKGNAGSLPLAPDAKRFLDLGNGERISMDQVVEYRMDECVPPCVTLIMANKDWKSTYAPRGIDRKAAAQWLDELFGARPLWKVNTDGLSLGQHDQTRQGEERNGTKYAPDGPPTSWHPDSHA
jgi:hypothetical protein